MSKIPHMHRSTSYQQMEMLQMIMCKQEQRLESEISYYQHSVTASEHTHKLLGETIGIQTYCILVKRGMQLIFHDNKDANKKLHNMS